MSWWCPSPISVLSAWSPVGTTLGPLSVEPRITSGPLSVDSRGYPSWSSQHPLPERERDPPQCMIKKKDPSLNEHKSRAGDLQSPRSLCQGCLPQALVLSWEQGEDFLVPFLSWEQGEESNLLR